MSSKMEKKKNVVIILLLIIILLLLCLIFIILNNVELTWFNINKGIKVNTSKDYVYDAKYSYDNKYTEFYRYSLEEDSVEKITYYGIDVEYTNGTQYLDNLKVPYINIDSDDARMVNKKLESLYFEEAIQFDQCALEALDTEMPSCSQILTYRFYVYEDFLSVVVINSFQATSHWLLNYHVYNFDLNTGKIVKYNEALDKFHYKKDSVLSELESLLDSKMDSLYGDVLDLTKACSGDSNCYDKAHEMLENDIISDSIPYFIDEEGELNVLAIAYCDALENGTVNSYLLRVIR